ncbi:HTH_38 domain-containing protein [Trichonephila clavipes]|nr:HTH_38 domain-containing protein [Trichonephila clavipes]
MRQGLEDAMRILVAQLGEFKSTEDASRRNRRQYEQLTTLIGGRIIASQKQVGRIGRIGPPHSVGAMSVVARCWQQWITEGRAYRRGGSGRPRNTNDREDRAIRRVGHFGTNNVASIDSTPLTSFQTSSAIKRNHKETTDRSWLEEPTSAKTLTTDPTS